MGPPVDGQASVSSVLDLLPSPTDSVHNVFDSPAYTYANAPLQSPDGIKLGFRLDDTVSALSPEPGLVKTHPITTPPIDYQESSNMSNMNLIVGGALAPLPSSPPVARLPKSNPAGSLRLPSFNALGIAAPHPDRFSSSETDEALLYGLDGMLKPNRGHRRSEPDLLGAFRGTHIASPPASPPREPRQLHQPPATAMPPPTSLPHDVAALTPPTDLGEIKWTAPESVSHAAMASPSAERPHTAANEQHDDSADTNGGSEALPSREETSSSSLAESRIDGALDVLLDSLRHLSVPNNPLRILSHALPSPSPAGHYYPAIIDAIHIYTPSSPTTWINVFHAVQGRFNLADLPTSPPSTPGPPIGGDDYFTQKVFDSAVSISDYQEDLSALPRSPRPVVPPSSINVSVVERYIPPSSSHEFAHMFKPTGPSVLVDRLVELSPQGTLLFVYPTRVGAQTFMQDYLGPILDPLLRSLMVVNGLSSDLGRTLGNMPAAKALPDYEQLHRSMKTLCAKLSQPGTRIAGFHGENGAYSLVHASKQQVRISREAWARDWWAKQEKPRIREVMTKYSQEAQKRSSNEHVERAPTPTELIQQLLDGVCKRPYPSGQEPEDGIEVSVFIIKRGGGQSD